MADVLVVEDDDDLAELVTMAVEAGGHVVRRAANGREGLDALAQRLVDVVLLDVEMPHLDGPDMAARMLLENAGRERIPVVLVSGVVGLRDVAARVGTPYFLAKPYDFEKLAQVLALALRERRAPFAAAPAAAR